MKTDINRTVLNITTYCNLKCKHCLAFIPYYDTHRHISFTEAKEILAQYFQIVDSVGHFTITGGEPLLNPDVLSIMEEVILYKEQIRDSLDFVTNSSIMISPDILNFFETHRQDIRLILSNYGNGLSTQFDNIKKALDDRNIPYRVSSFCGKDLYYDGWIDFSDHSVKWKTLEERDRNAQKCLHGAGKYFVINDGELHRCSRSYWRIRQNIIPKIIGEYVPLTDNSYTLEEKREALLTLMNAKSTTSCAHCVGFTNEAERVLPAQQLGADTP